MNERTPLYGEDGTLLLGFIAEDNSGWRAETIFGYVISRAQDRDGAEQALRDNGLGYLKGVWQYLDEDDREWHPCVIKTAQERQVTVVRTNALGYEDPDDYKLVVIEDVDETRLVKA